MLQDVLNFTLVVFNPYRDLASYLKDIRLTGLTDSAWYVLHLIFCVNLSRICVFHGHVFDPLALLTNDRTCTGEH